MRFGLVVGFVGAEAARSGRVGGGLLSSRPESENVGTLSVRTVAEAFGVVSVSSEVVAAETSGLLTVSEGDGGGGIDARSGCLLAPFLGFSMDIFSFSSDIWSSLSLTVSPPLLFPSVTAPGARGGSSFGGPRKEPRKDKTHLGGRKHNRTADATIRDIPRYPMAFRAVVVKGGVAK